MSRSFTPFAVARRRAQAWRAMAATTLALCAVVAEAASDFPEGASTPEADAVRQHLVDKTFSFGTDKGPVRMQFRDKDYFISTDSDYKASGGWRTTPGQLCGSATGKEVCSEVRLHGGQMYMKRVSNGEVVRLDPN